MRKGQVIVVQLVDGRDRLIRWFSRALELFDIVVDVNFLMNGRHRYGFRFGPSEANGSIEIGYEDVERKRLNHLKFQPWDYRTRLEELDDKVFISIPDATELARAYEINKTFNGGTPDRDAMHWLTANNGKVESEGLFVSLKNDSTPCIVKCYPRGA